MPLRSAARQFVRRWAVNPVVTLIAFGVLVGDVMMLPRDSTVGELRRRFIGPGLRMECFSTSFAWLVHDDAQWRLLPRGIENIPRELSARIEWPQDVVLAGIEGVYKTGFWALTRRNVGSWAHIGGLRRLGGGDISPEDERIIRALLATTHPKQPAILWSGVLHNAGALVTGAVLLVSLAWVPHAPAWVRERKTKRALTRGRCPACAYDIRGLSRCPECGREVPI